ncbi:hypothetical protein E1B28_000625 [Marasmius oreades]|uniref:beta-glucosidase n=1 Tax=Marasmius oreades TaxID=181124 RepID=A0A9P8AEJ4_9AGAR|nr:uncharacterized protein E1B28_000625 [Marasmius oreades]KAG7098712.1 hypothetical protein E1B28_000625 [Marasmius oreades]
MSWLLLFALWILSVDRSHAFTQRSWDESVGLANQVVSLMTLDEKIGMATGVGQFSSRCVGNIKPPSRSFSVSGLTITIPPLCMSDGPAGMRLVKDVTGFPTGINVASTFSRRLMRARGVAMAEEFRAKGSHIFLGPAMDLMRNPKMGRAWESFGPDPYLNGEASFETTTGVQSVGVQACAKHFIANNQEHWRYGLSADVDDRTLHELYWWPFMRSVEANVSAVMCAYNRFNKTSSCHNENLLGPNGILRKEGFQGFVVSDWGATHDSAKDNALAGLDMEQPGDFLLIGGGVYGNNLKNAVNDGSVPVSRLNEMVTRILTPWFRLGQDQDFPSISFDVQHPDGTGSQNVPLSVRSDAHTALAREIGAASAILLKNARVTNNGQSTGTSIRGLPLSQSIVKSIAIIGQDARQLNQNCPGGLNACNDGTMVIGWGSGSNSLDFVVPPVDAITDFIGNSATITTSLSNDLNAGAKAATGKDVAIVFANAMSGELGFYQIVVGNMGDRNDLDLWFKGGSLIERVASVNPNTIVVIHSVGPVPLGWNTHPNITAIIYAGAPGEQTGPSLVDVLWGAVNPSGRLPFSVADSEDSYGTTIVTGLDGFPTINYTEGLFIDYRYMDSKNIAPRYEFGYGLSYTTFEYSGLSISSSESSHVVTFTVTNTGAFDGTEIPQLYLGFPSSSGEPRKVLRGFEEVKLANGQSKQVSLSVSQKEISIWDSPSQSWVRPSGAFTVYVGASIKDIRLTGTF